MKLDENLNIDKIFNLALKNHKNSNLEVAKNLYNKVLELDPNFRDAHNNLGVVLQQFGKFQEAMGYFEKALKIDPNYVGSLNNLGLSFKELSKFQEAMGYFEKALKIDPNFRDANNNLGIVLQQFGKLQEAISCFKKAIKVDPNFKDAHNNLGTVFQQLGKLKKASIHFKKATEIDPNFQDAHFNLGMLFYSQYDIREAANEFKLINFKNSNSYLLNCLFKLNEKSFFYEVFDQRIKKNNIIDALIGSSCSRSEIRYGINIANPFCKDPLNYLVHKNLTKTYDFNNIFIKTVRKVLAKNKIKHRNQRLLTNGIQTSDNFFNHEVEFTGKIKQIINLEIESYKKTFADSKEGFLKNFPHQYTVNAWVISMKNGGKLDAHIHENGWLSGSIYINVPKKIKNDSGNLVICLENEYEKKENPNIKRSIDVVTGSMCLFPASLLHYTIPFESEEDRIVLAFDVMAKN